MGAQEDHERFSGIAEELGLEDNDRDSFINSAMKRKGYKPVTSWADPEPTEEQEESDFFSNRKKKKEEAQAAATASAGEKRKASGSNWQYE